MELIYESDKYGEMYFEEENFRLKRYLSFMWGKEHKEKAIYMHVYDSMYIEQKLGIEDYGEDFFDEDDIEKNKAYYDAQYLVYEKYVDKFSETLELIENTMLQDYACFDKKTITLNEIQNLCEISRLTIFDDRVEILCSCEWRKYVGMGIILRYDGEILCGTEDILD